jgi:drug/metabolite transporter (DMT)-like permease
MSKDTLKTLAAYLTIYFVRGSTYFFIKMALESFPPYPIVGLRFTLGGALLLSMGLACLAVVGSLAISAYAYLLVHEPSIRIVSYALVNPGIAVFLGFLFGKETAAPYMAVGLPLILVGLATMLYGEMLLKRIRTGGRGKTSPQ